MYMPVSACVSQYPCVTNFQALSHDMLRNSLMQFDWLQTFIDNLINFHKDPCLRYCIQKVNFYALFMKIRIIKRENTYLYTYMFRFSVHQSMHARIFKKIHVRINICLINLCLKFHKHFIIRC